MEYLYVQSGLRLCPREDLDREIDEGFEDVEIDDTVQPLITDQMPEDPITVTTDLTDSGSEDEEEYVHALVPCLNVLVMHVLPILTSHMS